VTGIDVAVADAAMMRVHCLLLVLGGLAACTSSPSDPELGTGQFSRNGVSQHVTYAWATTNFAFYGDQNDSYGGYSIVLTTDGVSGANGPIVCSDRKAFAWIHQLAVMTPEVFWPGKPGNPTLKPGDVPIIADDAAPNNGPPAATIAYFAGTDPGINAGKVTVESFDSSSIAGSFTASAQDGTAIAGSFTVPICAGG
jgi:hypothetical protein